MIIIQSWLRHCSTTRPFHHLQGSSFEVKERTSRMPSIQLWPCKTPLLCTLTPTNMHPHDTNLHRRHRRGRRGQGTQRHMQSSSSLLAPRRSASQVPHASRAASQRASAYPNAGSFRSNLGSYFQRRPANIDHRTLPLASRTSQCAEHVESSDIDREPDIEVRAGLVIQRPSSQPPRSAASQPAHSFMAPITDGSRIHSGQVRSPGWLRSPSQVDSPSLAQGGPGSFWSSSTTAAPVPAFSRFTAATVPAQERNAVPTPVFSRYIAAEVPAFQRL